MKTIYFDANFGYPWVTGLSHIFMMRQNKEPYISHIFTISQEGEDDDIWIPKLNKKEHIVISADKGRKSPRLTEVCKQHQVTHIIFSTSAHHLQKFDKARAIISLWPQIEKTFEAPLGSRYQLKYESKNERFSMVQIS